MRRSETIRRRAGFSLIELLVVIGIIALLAGLLIPAIMKIQIAGARTRVKAEISEMSLAVDNFKSTYNDLPYFPSALILCNDYAAVAAANPTWAAALNDSRQFISKVWPKGIPSNMFPPAISALNDGSVKMDGNQVLVFLLGGIPPTDNLFGPGWQGNRAGFLNSPINPMNRQGNVCLPPASGAQAKGPFFNFKTDRIDSNGHYLDHYGTPYYYFSSKNGNDYAAFGIYRPALNPSNQPRGFTNTGGYGGMEPFRGADGKYLNADSFQIISAGRDKFPGPGGVYQAGVGDYGPAAQGGDDLANFHTGPLSGDD